RHAMPEQSNPFPSGSPRTDRRARTTWWCGWLVQASRTTTKLSVTSSPLREAGLRSHGRRTSPRCARSVLAGGDDSVPQHSDSLDLRLHHISWAKELGRGPGEPYAVGRTRGDDRARQQGHAFGDPLDDGVDRVDHVPRVAVLLDLAVDPLAQAERLRVGELVGGDDPRSGRAGSVQALALEVLTAPAALDVAGGHVVEHGVSENELASVLPLDVGAGLADHYRELDLPVDLVTDRGIDRDVGVRLGQGGDRLRENRGRAGLAAFQTRGFGRV